MTLGGLELGLSHVLLDGTTFEPEAQGFLVAGGSSSKPNVTTIKAGDSFAVYQTAWDIGTTYPVIGLSNGRVKGMRNGKPFWYTAAQPRVISDVAPTGQRRYPDDAPAILVDSPYPVFVPRTDDDGSSAVWRSARVLSFRKRSQGATVSAERTASA